LQTRRPAKGFEGLNSSLVVDWQVMELQRFGQIIQYLSKRNSAESKVNKNDPLLVVELMYLMPFCTAFMWFELAS